MERELFGGAILASFPARYVDVSDFRPVPDNQEVWTDANRDESVIVEILERVEAGPSDAEGAAAWFFRDLADVNAASVASGASIIHQTRALTPADLPRLGAPVAPGSSICAGESSMTKARSRRTQPRACHRRVRAPAPRTGNGSPHHRQPNLGRRAGQQRCRAGRGSRRPPRSTNRASARHRARSRLGSLRMNEERLCHIFRGYSPRNRKRRNRCVGRMRQT